MSHDFFHWHVTIGFQVHDMDPEKTQLSTKSLQIYSPATGSASLRRDRLRRKYLKVLFFIAGAVSLLALHGLVQHDTSTTLQQKEADNHGRPRLTTKERERLFLYVHRPLQLSFVD